MTLAIYTIAFALQLIYGHKNEAILKLRLLIISGINFNKVSGKI